MSRMLRELPEMVEALGRQIRLLESHLVSARENSDFWGEVACKLRLLVIDRDSNKALLRRVADAYAGRLSLQPKRGPRTLDELMASPMLRHGEKSITFADLIRRWAQQQGGANEDWSTDYMLLEAQRRVWTVRPIEQPVSLAHGNLAAVAVRVIECGKQLLDGIARIEGGTRGSAR
jgi:hypothetical protein